MTNFITKKSLLVPQVDVGGADRSFSERYLLQDVPGHCSNPADHMYDEYGRLANPYSLTTEGHGSCNVLSPHHNIKSWIARENAERAFIPITYTTKAEGYDTMHRGRTMMNNAGGFSGQGGWQRINMSRPPVNNSCPPISVHRMSDSFTNGEQHSASLYYDKVQ